jgi:hypothetical protein
VVHSFNMIVKADLNVSVSYLDENETRHVVGKCTALSTGTDVFCHSISSCLQYSFIEF